MIDPHKSAMAERRAKIYQDAIRLFWIPVNFDQYEFNVGIQIKTDSDWSNIDLLDLSKVIDNIDDNVLQSNLLDLIIVSNLLYDYVASYYVSNDIHVNVTNFNQPVITTIYNFNQPL